MTSLSHLVMVQLAGALAILAGAVALLGFAPLSAHAAGGLAAIGTALALLPYANWRPVVWLLCIFASLIGATGLLGNRWNMNDLLGIHWLPTATAPTSLGLAIFAIGTLFASRRLHTLSEPSVLKRASIELKVAGGYFSVILLLIAGSVVTHRASTEAATSAQRVTHAQEVKARLAQRYATTAEAESAAIVHVLDATPESERAFRRAVESSRRHAKAYAHLTAQDTAPAEMRQRLDFLEEERISALEQIVADPAMRGPFAVVAAVASTQATGTMNALRGLAGDMDDFQTALLLAGEGMADFDRQRALFFLYLTLSTAAVVFTLLSHAIRREMLARSRADESVRRLNGELEQRVAQRTQALEQSSAIYRHTLDNMLEGCQVIGFDLRYRYVNAAAALQNRVSQEALVGRTLAEAHPGIESSDIYAIVCRCMVDRIAQHREHEYVHPDGVRAAFQISVLPAPEGVSLFSVDITERKAAEAEILAINAGLERRVTDRTSELELARAAAEEASRAKSAFLATMSHEIRTPMNGVVGMVEVLFHSDLSEDQADAVRTIRTSAFSLLHVIDHILDFSKIEAGRLELERAPVQLLELIEGVCDTLLPMAMDNHVDLNLFVSPLVPAQIWSDATRLRQILFNLAGNAIKFGIGEPRRRGNVSIRIGMDAQAGTASPTLVMRFIDDGIGMAQETLGRLFSPFTQAEASTTRRFGGTGLGLTISKRLVTLMHGSIAVESLPDQGATFTVTLPVEEVLGGPSFGAPVLQQVHCAVVGAGQEVDDLCVYLAHAGAEVHRMADLAAAVRYAHTATRPVVVQKTQRNGTSLAVLRAAFAELPDVHHVLVERGQRRQARIAATDIVSVDGNCLHRAALLRAVGVAAGRQSPEVFRDGAAEDPLGERIEPPTIAQARAQGRLILIAEDDDVNQKVIVRQIEMLGYAGEIARDGLEALRAWQAGDYAMLLTDLHMPGLDGYGLTAAIRDHEKAAGDAGRRRLPILALTANALRGEAIRAHAAGIDDYLTKPLELHLLQAALNKWLPLRQTEEAADPSAAGAHGMPPTAVVAVATAVLDLKVLERLVGGNPESVRELLDAYFDGARRQAVELHTAHAADDLRVVGDVAHKLKSSSRAVGAVPLGDLCAELENACRSGVRDAVALALAQVDAGLHAVMAQAA